MMGDWHKSPVWAPNGYEQCANPWRFQPRWHRPADVQEGPDSVPVEELLDVDREYRRLAATGRLPCIAPGCFNPTGDAWLPVLHTQKEASLRRAWWV